MIKISCHVEEKFVHYHSAESLNHCTTLVFRVVYGVGNEVDLVQRVGARRFVTPTMTIRYRNCPPIGVGVGRITMPLVAPYFGIGWGGECILAPLLSVIDDLSCPCAWARP